MGKPTGKKKNPETPADSSVGGGNKSGKSFDRSASKAAAFDEDMEIFINRALELKEEGNKLFQKRDNEGAMLRYDKAVKLLPREHGEVAYLRTSMASCYMQMGLGEYPNAINECNLALEASPRYSKALLKRARCYEALNKLDFAFRDSRIVLNMEPENVSANEIFERVKKILVSDIDPSCVLCKFQIESRNHLFFECSYSRVVWENIARKLLGSKFRLTWDGVMELIADDSLEKSVCFLVRYAFQITIHSIWRERNGRRHGEPSTPPTQLALRIDKGIRNRISTIRENGHGRYASLMETWFASR